MSYAAINPDFNIGHKKLRRMPGLYGLGQVSGVLPAGTQLVYKATFTPGFAQVVTAASIAADVAHNVAANAGIQVVGSNASASVLGALGSQGFTLTLQLAQAYTSEQMVQQVMDSAVSAATGGVESSNISVTGMGTGSSNAPVGGAPGSGAPDPNNPNPNPISWWDEDSLGLGLNNGDYLMIGGIGAVGLAFAAGRL